MRIRALKLSKNHIKDKGPEAIITLCSECKFCHIPYLILSWNSVWTYICGCSYSGQNLECRKQTIWDLDSDLLSLFMVIDFIYFKSNTNDLSFLGLTSGVAFQGHFFLYFFCESVMWLHILQCRIWWVAHEDSMLKLITSASLKSSNILNAGLNLLQIF